MRGKHSKDAIADQTGTGKHAKPIDPHHFSHPHAGKLCRCIKLCKVCGFPEQLCVMTYRPRES